MPASLLLVLLAGTTAPTGASDGPLVKPSSGWSHVDGHCVHRACGSYVHNASGLEVHYAFSPPEESTEACDLPEGSLPHNGVVGGIPYCSFEQFNAREHQIAALYRARPDFKAHPEWLPEVSLSPEGASFQYIAFIYSGTVWRLHADICTGTQRVAFRNLVFKRLRLPPAPP